MLFLTPLCVYAQHRTDSLTPSKSEVAVGIGPSGLYQTVHFTTPYLSFSNSECPLVYGQYLYNVSKHVGLGGLMSFACTRKNYMDARDSYISLSPTACFYWFRRKLFGMYSKVGLGVVFIIGDNFETGPEFFVSPICIDFGRMRWRGFVELLSVGLSYPLFANVGIKHNF